MASLAWVLFGCLCSRALGVKVARGALPKSAGRCLAAANAREGPSFVVDNTQLKAITKGIGYRLSKDLKDIEQGSIAPWGSTVVGVDQKDGWLKVGECYLPTALKGLPVLTGAEAGPAGAGVQLNLREQVLTGAVGVSHDDGDLAKDDRAGNNSLALASKQSTDMREMLEKANSSFQLRLKDSEDRRQELAQKVSRLQAEQAATREEAAKSTTDLRAALEREKAAGVQRLEASEAKNKELAEQLDKLTEEEDDLYIKAQVAAKNVSSLTAEIEAKEAQAQNDLAELRQRVNASEARSKELAEQLAQKQQTQAGTEQPGQQGAGGGRILTPEAGGDAGQAELVERLNALSSADAEKAKRISALEAELEQRQKDADVTISEMVMQAQKDSSRTSAVLALSGAEMKKLEKELARQTEEAERLKTALLDNSGAPSNDSATTSLRLRLEVSEQKRKELSEKLKQASGDGNEFLIMASVQVEEAQKQLKKANKTFQLRYKASEERNKKLNEQLGQLRKEQANATASIAELQAQLDRENATNTSWLQAQLAQQQRLAESLSQRLNASEAGSAVLREQLDGLKSHEATIEAAARQNVSVLQAKLARLQHVAQEIAQRADASEAKNRAYAQMLARLKQENASYTNHTAQRISELLAKLAAVQSAAQRKEAAHAKLLQEYEDKLANQSAAASLRLQESMPSSSQEAAEQSHAAGRLLPGSWAAAVALAAAAQVLAEC